MKTQTPMRAHLRAEPESRAVTLEFFDYIDTHDGLSVGSLHAALRDIGEVDTIKVLMHSRGGNAIEGFAMYTLLSQHPARIEIDILGIAASAASVVAMAGDVVRIADTGWVMIHDPWICAAGNSAELRRHADRLDALIPAVLRAYGRKSKATPEQLTKWMSEGAGEGTWFDAAAAVAAGFADEMYSAPVPRQAIPLDGLGTIPDAVMATFGTPPVEPEPVAEDHFTQALRALGEPPATISILAEAFAALGTSLQPTTAETAGIDQALLALCGGLFPATEETVL